MKNSNNSWLNALLDDFDNLNSSEEINDELLEPITISQYKKNISEKKKSSNDTLYCKENGVDDEKNKSGKAYEESDYKDCYVNDNDYFEDLRAKITDSLKRVNVLFRLDEYNIDDFAYDITEEIWSMDKDDLLNETDRNIDRVVFYTISNMIGIGYSDFFCRNYKGVKQLILSCLNTPKYYQNEYIYNSAYVDSLTNEYLLKILIDKSLVTKQNIYCRFDSDILLMKELIANKDKKMSKLNEIFDRLKLPLILISLATGSVPMLASSAYIFYLDRCDDVTKKIICEEDLKKMNNPYPEQVFFQFDGKHSR